MGDLATHQPGGLDRHAELAGQLGGRRRLLSGGQQPDCQEPLAQIGACVGEDRAGGQRALIVAARALEQPAAAQVPGTLVPTAATGEAVRPAVLEDRLPTVLLGRVQLHELNQRLGMCHLFCLLQVAAQEAMRGTGRKGIGTCEKFAGTLNSFGVAARFLHSKSAVHGEVGIPHRTTCSSSCRRAVRPTRAWR